MLRDLQETDVNAICEINQEALGYSFSPEDTASQLARLSQDSHHFLLGYEDDTSHELVGIFMLRFMNPFIQNQVLTSWL